MKKTDLEKTGNKINKLLGDVFRSFRLFCTFSDINGAQLGYYSHEGRSNFCRFISFYDVEQLCSKFYRESFRHCRQGETARICVCPYGLVNAILPIGDEGNEPTFVTMGPLLYHDADDHSVTTVLRQNFLLKPRAREIWQLLSEIPVKSESDVDAMIAIVQSALRGIVSTPEVFSDEDTPLPDLISTQRDEHKRSRLPYRQWIKNLFPDKSNVGGDLSKEELDHFIMVLTDYILGGTDLNTAVSRALEYIEILTELTVEAELEPGHIFTPHAIDVEKITSAGNKSELEGFLLYYNEMFRKYFLSEYGARHSDVIARAIHFIQNHYGDISLADVAEAVNLNPTYFSNYFKRYTGQSYSAYLNKVRIEESKRLLLTDCSLSEIAQRVGFSDQSYFTNVFKRAEGISPNRWRKNQVRGEEEQ